MNKTSYLVQRLFSKSGIRGLSVLCVDDRRVDVYEFDRESEQTVYISAPVAVLDAALIDEFLMDDLELIMSGGKWGSAKEKRLDDYFRSSNLYYDLSIRDSLPALVKLTSSGCYILPII